jgi:inhibitor of cysteine peptidase
MDIKVGQESDGRELKLKVGQVLRVTLPENRTSGYAWQIEQNGAPVCTLIHDAYIAPGGDPATHVGSPGTHEWRFRADAAGVASIEMQLGRRWESKAAKRFSLRLLVS